VHNKKNNKTKAWLKLATPCTEAQVTSHFAMLLVMQTSPNQFLSVTKPGARYGFSSFQGKTRYGHLDSTKL